MDDNKNQELEVKEKENQVQEENKKEENFEADTKEEIIENVSEEKVEPIIESQNDNVEPVAEPDLNYGETSLLEVERERQIFKSIFNKHNTLKWVISIIAIVLLVIAWLLIPNLSQNQSWGTPLIVIIVVVILGGLLLYTFMVRKTLNNRMHKYFDNYYLNTNKYIFDQEGFDKIEAQKPSKISIEQFTENQMYVDIYEVGSRGLTSGEYHHLPFMVCDCAGQIKTDKKLSPVFVGKYLFAASNYDCDDSMIIYLKSNRKSFPPTNISDKKAVYEDDKMTIWTNNKNWKKVMSAKSKRALSSIKFSKDFIDVAFCLTSGRIFACMNYEDTMMIIPMEKPFDTRPIKNYKNEVKQILDVFEAFNN